MLYLYNSFTKKKEQFKTISKSKVKIYVCGMTVYDYCHIGHARVLIVFDLIVNWLKKIGYEVTYVRNITDIDDKIIKKSLDEKIEVEKIDLNLNIKEALKDDIIKDLKLKIFENINQGYYDESLDLLKQLKSMKLNQKKDMKNYIPIDLKLSYSSLKNYTFIQLGRIGLCSHLTHCSLNSIQ